MDDIFIVTARAICFFFRTVGRKEEMSKKASKSNLCVIVDRRNLQKSVGVSNSQRCDGQTKYKLRFSLHTARLYDFTS